LSGRSSRCRAREYQRLAGRLDGGVEAWHISNVGEELFDWSEAAAWGAARGEKRAHGVEEIFDIAEEEVVFITEVGVESRATDVGAVEDLLDGDGIERLLLHELDEGVAESVAIAEDAAVRPRHARKDLGWRAGIGLLRFRTLGRTLWHW
jgi:hypothetical protein